MKKDWTRYEEAKRLRDSGMTFKAIGISLGVGMQRAREIVEKQERRERALAAERDNPSPIPWHRGLAYGMKYKLEIRGFRSKEDCEILCSDDLVVYRRSVALPGWEPCEGWEWKCSEKRLSFAEVNEVRAWLGASPFVPPQRIVSEAAIERAKKLLERNGYKIEFPNAELGT
jgi:hypothetical protein